jgi:hypothetical protein
MSTIAVGTLPRDQKGRVAPPPVLAKPLQDVVDVVSAWPDVDTTVHWHFNDKNRVDGVDFYTMDKELGHIHLDGDIHLATSPTLGNSMIAEGVAKAFPYLRGWVEENVMAIGTAASVELFRRNYEALQS